MCKDRKDSAELEKRIEALEEQNKVFQYLLFGITNPTPDMDISPELAMKSEDSWLMKMLIDVYEIRKRLEFLENSNPDIIRAQVSELKTKLLMKKETLLRLRALNCDPAIVSEMEASISRLESAIQSISATFLQA